MTEYSSIHFMLLNMCKLLTLKSTKGLHLVFFEKEHFFSHKLIRWLFFRINASSGIPIILHWHWFYNKIEKYPEFTYIFFVYTNVKLITRWIFSEFALFNQN